MKDTHSLTVVAPSQMKPRTTPVSRCFAKRLAAAALSAAFAGGCVNMQAQREAQQGVSAYFIGDYAGAVDRLAPLAQQTDENFVLNNVRLGSAALLDYDLDEAEAAFLRAYEVMNSVGANDGGRTLGAALVDEKIKIWKGEPFERAMANFYLGLIYYMRADYANARGAFENALFKLRDYGPDANRDQYREADNDFALASIMLGRALVRLGREDLAQREFENAVRMHGYLAPLADVELHKRTNVLLVIEYGRGPTKVTDFDGSILAFAPPPVEAGPMPLPQVVIDGSLLDPGGRNRPPIDLLALAQDRKWQSIDTIRTVKSALGTGLLAGGLYEGTRRRGNSSVALGLLAAGLIAKATSQADTRQWEMLPRTVYLVPVSMPPGKHDITIEFPQARGLRQTWRGLVAPSEGDATYYFRPQRYNPGPFDWPPVRRPPAPRPAAQSPAAK